MKLPERDHLTSMAHMEDRAHALDDGIQIKRVPIPNTNPVKYRYTVSKVGSVTPEQERDIKLRFSNHPHMVQIYMKNHKAWSFLVEKLWQVDSILKMLESGDEPGDRIQLRENKPAYNV